MRQLIVRTRSVPLPARAGYGNAWAACSAFLKARRVNAWAFQSAREPDLFMEFVEFDADLASSLMPEIAEASAALEIIAVSVDSSTWKEWSTV